MWWFFIIGVLLVIDGIISIILASPDRVTYNLFLIKSIYLIYLGHICRLIRIILGLLIIIFNKNLPNFWLFVIGIYLILDAAFSIILASRFNNWDDYFRIARILIGLILIYIGFKT